MEPIIINDPTESPIKRFWEKLKQPKVYGSIFALTVVLAVLLSITNQYLIAGRGKGAKHSSILSFLGGEKIEKKIVSPLDGLRYPASHALRHPLGVMIENHPDSRPQTGLVDASVVYEAIAEGGITRFLAIFGPKLPERIGPVRSARTYYLDWCLEYDCFYAHVGGNIDALDLIPKLSMKDLDQFRYGTKAYQRFPKRGIATEHTVYADPEKLYGLAKANNWPETGGFPSVDFKTDRATDDRTVSQQVSIEISSQLYNTTWTYDPVDNGYSRAMGNLPHNDSSTGQQIKSKVIIVQEVSSRPTVTRINETGLVMDTVGEGKAKIIQDGKVTEGTWKKRKQKERTIFSDESGQEIRFNAGQRWITIVNPGSKVTTR